MKLSTILDFIDNGHFALPQLQRSFVWNRDQVRRLFYSLYKTWPVGQLILWVTQSETAAVRGDHPITSGVVKLLLDGQQRITTIFAIARGHVPPFFEGNKSIFTGLYFHVRDEIFEFYNEGKMRSDPLWVNVTKIFNGSYASEAARIFADKTLTEAEQQLFFSRLTRISSLLDREINIEEVSNRSAEEVAEMFNAINSNGTKLTKAALVLAKLSVTWPGARPAMQRHLDRLAESGYEFKIDWFLRATCAIVTGRVRFDFIEKSTPAELSSAFETAARRISDILALLNGRLGIDYNKRLINRTAIITIARFIQVKGGDPTSAESGKLMFWFLHTAIVNRYTGGMDKKLDPDLAAANTGEVDRLLAVCRRDHGPLRIEPAHFDESGKYARFATIMYIMVRYFSGKEWSNGTPARVGVSGKMNRLEVHHIFPRARLRALKMSKALVNSVVNFAFISKKLNLAISDRLPSVYMPAIEAAHPGALASQWIPSDTSLWGVSHYLQFIEARKVLLAEHLTLMAKQLLGDDDKWMAAGASTDSLAMALPAGPIPQSPARADAGDYDEEEDEEEVTPEELTEFNDWMAESGLPKGEVDYASDFMLDIGLAPLLAWPKGFGRGITCPTLFAPNATAVVKKAAKANGWIVETDLDDLRDRIEEEVIRALL